MTLRAVPLTEQPTELQPPFAAECSSLLDSLRGHLPVIRYNPAELELALLTTYHALRMMDERLRRAGL